MKMTEMTFDDTKCDFCREGKARYDEQVKGHTAWAHLCEECHATVGTGIGSILRWSSDPPPKSQIEEPSMEELEQMMFDGVAYARCEHGCECEPDGYCQHGRPSWLIVKGLI